jgi:hypothetical protein
VRNSQLNPEEHRELRIAFGVLVGIPVPGFAVPASVEVLSGQRVLFSSDFLQPLHSKTTMQQLKPLAVAALWARAGHQNQTIQVQVSVAGTVKCRQLLKLELPKRLTNFEGALKHDALSLGDVDDEYEAILQRLG